MKLRNFWIPYKKSLKPDDNLAILMLQACAGLLLGIC